MDSNTIAIATGYLDAKVVVTTINPRKAINIV